ncbi:hypothetical protein O0I10_001167 [Lichtheimia ornata]|uniref:Uncharacterized protein n=1 Tax=Lichtheimia ornata TaxID=688661 RepID=A0AAD7Y399_9FUNG|nr:uncharacterized protein O0I10_001167 [Lichtheimia ornata]KAJ8662990.1 hypothetical protein O0I10_001167 [Lichtheimia ornata]
MDATTTTTTTTTHNNTANAQEPPTFISHPRVPTSAFGPATITIIVALVLITCCILHCHRVQYTVRSRRWMKTTSPSTVVAHNTSSTATPLPLPRSNHNSNPHFALQQHGEQWDDEKYQQQQAIQQPQPVMIKSHG